MLKFGKKISYRPLFFSLSISLIMGLLFGLNISSSLGWEIGSIMFVLMIIGHYLLVMPVLFNYWDSDNTHIHYNDIQKYRRRFVAIFLPNLLRRKVISKNQIIAIDLLGLPQRNSNLSSDLVVSEEGGFMYNLLLMINEPVKIRLTLRDHSNIDLDLSRDYVNRPSETIGKLKMFLNEFNPQVIHLSDQTRALLAS